MVECRRRLRRFAVSAQVRTAVRPARPGPAGRHRRRRPGLHPPRGRPCGRHDRLEPRRGSMSPRTTSRRWCHTAGYRPVRQGGARVLKAGFAHVALVQVSAERQRDFIDWSARELLPALRELW